MHDRCVNSNSQAWRYYGERGISVCEEWADYKTFRVWALTNGYRKGLTLDRADNDGNYEPGNCRWVTMLVQRRNQSNTKPITFRGETMLQTDWAKRIGISDVALIVRLRRWPLERALTAKNHRHG